MLDVDHKLKTESFLRTVFKTFDVSNDGKITEEEIGKVLCALGRPVEEKERQRIGKKFAGKGDKVDWSSSDFLKEIATTKVSDVNLVEDFVLSAAFSTFDQDLDGYITPEDMKAVVKLFLPQKVQNDDEYIQNTVERMDLNCDGMIAYDEFVQTVKEIGAPDFLRYYDPVLKAITTLIGFLVYCMSFYFGIAAVFNCNYD